MNTKGKTEINNEHKKKNQLFHLSGTSISHNIVSDLAIALYLTNGQSSTIRG